MANIADNLKRLLGTTGNNIQEILENTDSIGYSGEGGTNSGVCIIDVTDITPDVPVADTAKYNAILQAFDVGTPVYLHHRLGYLIPMVFTYANSYGTYNISMMTSTNQTYAFEVSEDSEIARYEPVNLVATVYE